MWDYTDDLILDLKVRGNYERTIAAQVRYVNAIYAVRKQWTLKQAKQYIVELSARYRESTVNKYIQAFRNMGKLDRSFRFAKELKTFRENNQSKDILSEKEFWQFLNLSTSPKMNVLWLLIAMTGARGSEILNLKKSDMDIERACFFVRKDKIKESRILFIQLCFFEEIKSYINDFNDNDYLFNYRGKPLDIKSLEKDCKERLKILGITKNVTPHSSRHDYITRMVSQSNVIAVKQLVGHHRTATTEKYCHNNYHLLKKEAIKDPYFDKKNINIIPVREKLARLKKYIIEYCEQDERINMALIYRSLSLIEMAQKI